MSQLLEYVQIVTWFDHDFLCKSNIIYYKIQILNSQTIYEMSLCVEWHPKCYRSGIQVTFELYGHFRGLQVLYFKSDYIYSVLFYSGDLKAPWELWNPLSKVVQGKFHGTGRHSKCNNLQDRANSHRSWAWSILLMLTSQVYVDTIIQDVIISVLTWLKYSEL